MEASASGVAGAATGRFGAALDDERDAADARPADRGFDVGRAVEGSLVASVVDEVSVAGSPAEVVPAVAVRAVDVRVAGFLVGDGVRAAGFFEDDAPVEVGAVPVDAVPRDGADVERVRDAGFFGVAGVRPGDFAVAATSSTEPVSEGAEPARSVAEEESPAAPSTCSSPPFGSGTGPTAAAGS